MKAIVGCIAAVAAALLSYLPSVASASERTLDIDPVLQQTYVWCWVAVSEMVFEHFGVDNVNPGNNYQCGIVGALAQPGTWAEMCEYSCFQQMCIVPAGTAANLVRALKSFPKESATATQQSQPGVYARHVARPLTKAQLMSRIDDDEPVIAGINPSGRPAGLGASEHVALIVGYEDDGETLIVNDPAPFEMVSWSNPYIAAGGEKLHGSGQYRIARGAFIRSLGWGESIEVEKDGSAEPDDLPEYCCIPGWGRFGPFPNPGPNGSVVRRGHACQVPNAYGQQVPGRACD